MSGRAARTASSSTPRRSTTPGRKFWMNTSAPATIAISASSPFGFLRSRAIERLFRLLLTNDAENPPRRFAEARVKSPPRGVSTLITSAP